MDRHPEDAASTSSVHFHLTHIVVDFFVVTVSHFSESVVCTVDV